MANFNIDAQQAIAELKLLIAEVENLKKSTVNVNKANAESFDRLETSYKKLKSQVQLLANQLNYAKAIIAQGTAATNQNTSATNQNASATNSATAATNRNTSSNNQNASSSGKAAKGINGLANSFSDLLKAFGLIGGVQLFAGILKNAYEGIKTFDSLNFALEKITDTMGDATIATLDYENSQKFLLQISRDYGVELVAVTNRWLKFLAAAQQSGLSLRETENIFRSMTKAASVLGLRTDELSGVYLALEQMLSKGKVTTEELRRQLGERLPGAMGIMAASMGKTIPELDKMLKLGQVLSAEVLPAFAQAVENAYGIENTRKIETMVSMQNRLTAAWQTFIKNVSEGEGVIKKVIGGTLTFFTQAIKGLDYLTMSSDQEVRLRASILEEEFRLELEAKKKLQALRAAGYEDEKELEEQISKAKIALNKARTQEEKNVAEKALNESLLLMKKVNDNKTELMVDHGVESVDQFRAMYEKQLKIYNDYQAEISKPYRGRNLTFSGWEEQEGPSSSFRDDSKIDGVKLTELKANLSMYEALYNLSRKLAETSNVKIIADDEDKKGKIVMRVLNEIYDLKREIEQGIIRSQIASNQEIIDSERVNNKDRIYLIQKNTELRNRVIEIGYDIDEEKSRLHYEKEKKSIEKSLKEGKLTRVDADAQLLDLKKEFDQKKELAQQKADSAMFDNAIKAQNELLKIEEDGNKRRLNTVQNPFNLEIIEAKKVYEESKKSKKDLAILEKELQRIAIESANAQIRAQIAIQRAMLETRELSEEQIKAVNEKINELEASLKTFKPDDSKGWKDYLMSILEYASEFNAALGDLVDATHAKRIENINAEIEAEKNKYDKLIALAEGDEEQQKTLRHNKERTIEALEKKRLKEEQKQARARKAFAVADIAINTAAAIMGIWAQVPKFDFGISAAAMSVFVAGLGAVQTAAVLASPIPQYAEGGNITKDEIAMINDANAQEYVKRGNQILTTKTKNAIVDLKKGDVVYKDYDDMQNNSFLVPQSMNYNDLSENDFNKLSTTISSGIAKGFRGVKMQPVINFTNKKDNSSYGDKLTKWR